MKTKTIQIRITHALFVARQPLAAGTVIEAALPLAMDLLNSGRAALVNDSDKSNFVPTVTWTDPAAEPAPPEQGFKIVEPLRVVA